MMIGKWLAKCSDQQLSDVLTTPMRPGSWYEGKGPCLVGVVGRFEQGNGALDRREDARRQYPETFGSVEQNYDDLCAKLGEQRANALVRDRVLNILASRRLHDCNSTVATTCNI